MPVSVETLHNVPLFKLMDQDEIAELAKHIDEANFKANQLLYKAGDEGCQMYVVISGKVQTYVTDDDNKKVVVAEAEPGEFVGELSLLDNEPHTTTAIAIEPAHVCIIDREDLTRLFCTKPDAALDIIAVLGQRIRKTETLLSHRVARDPNEIIDEKTTFGQRVADKVAAFGGSWNFIGIFALFLLVWVFLNTVLVNKWDVYPFILLNLILSMLAAIQAPVIMMSQNRQDAKDRVRSEQDFKVNLKAELEIKELHEKIDQLREELLSTRQTAA